MAKTVKRTMYYPTFNTKTNEFDYKEVTHERPMTEKEKKWDTIINLALIIWLSLIAISLAIFVACVMMDWQLTGIISCICAVTFAIMGAICCHGMLEPIYDKVFAYSEEYGFEAEILKWEQITQEQNIIAQEWRAEHEFEELIRKAKLSENCNDIAQAAKYYAEHYIKGE